MTRLIYICVTYFMQKLENLHSAMVTRFSGNCIFFILSCFSSGFFFKTRRAYNGTLKREQLFRFVGESPNRAMDAVSIDRWNLQFRIVDSGFGSANSIPSKKGNGESFTIRRISQSGAAFYQNCQDALVNLRFDANSRFYGPRDKFDVQPVGFRGYASYWSYRKWKTGK